MQVSRSVVFGLLGVLWTSSGEAHIRLSSPTARYVQDDSGLKTGPCGSGTPTGTVTRLQPGQTLTVTWKESVPHAGHYRIALSAKASDFVEPTSLAIPSPLPSWDLADGIADKTGTQTYSQTVQLPSTECPACVLQLIQVMSTGSDGSNTGPFNGVYHACADLAITSGGSGDAGPDADAANRADVREVSATGGSMVSGGTTGRGGAVGTGGAAGRENDGGSGGAQGSGGSVGAGGLAGMGGNAADGTGGAPPSGGRDDVAPAHVTGGSPTAGGAGGGAGGVAGSSSTSGSSGGSQPAPSGAAGGTSGDQAPGGCACQVQSPSSSFPPGWLAAVAAWIVFRRRRSAST